MINTVLMNMITGNALKSLINKFTEKIIAVKDKIEGNNSNAFFWINNHQLFLVPQNLRRRIRNAHIGLYLHSPFPSSDVFRTFPHRKTILKSILNCDCIGFHVFEQARHLIVS